MSLKRIRLLALMGFGLLLCSCSGDITDPYNLTRISELNITTENDDGFKAEGFASALCVPETDAPLNAEGVNAAAYGLFNVTKGSYVAGSGLYEKVYPASTTKILT